MTLERGLSMQLSLAHLQIVLMSWLLLTSPSVCQDGKERIDPRVLGQSGEHPKLQVTALAYSPSGKYLATGHVGKLIQIWEPRQGAVLRQWAGHEGFIATLSF